MAKDNETDELSTPSSSKRPAAFRAKPYDANNSFIKKVATKVTDIIPQNTWISKWFNSSQDESGLQETETDNAQFDEYEEKQPPMKRPCIRMDTTHPPGTFTIQPRNRNAANDVEPTKDHFSNHNDTTQDFLEPPATGRNLNRFVASTPAFPMNSEKISEARSSLNVMMTEQNNNGATNGVDDNSESSESTSGCSSLIPQNNRQEAPPNSSYNTLFGNKRRFTDDKFNFTNHLQSPRSLFLDNSQRDTLANRRPSFNPSMMNNTTLNKSSQSLLSPFYPGNTTFGGANAANLYRSSSALTNPAQFHNASAPQRASVEVNPSNKTSNVDLSGMSHTARRILETLEQFSSPLSDARKMPVRNVMGNSSFQSSPTTSRKRTREEETASPKPVGLRHLTRELVVPTVPDMLRIRRKQKLQNSTVNARKIAAARTAAAAPPPAQQEYHIRTEADVEPTRNNQLKAKKKTNLEQQETVEAVNLPSIPLPISSLPRFEISLPQATKPALTPERPKQPMFQLQQQSNDDSFKFASPIRLADANKSLESINNFTFSKPITPSKISGFATNDSEELSKTLSVDSNDSVTTGSSFPNFIWSGPTQTALKPKEKVVEKKKEEFSGGIKVASELKQGSVMDFFKKQAETASKPVETASKPMETADSSESSDELWECSNCLIKNSGKKTKCVCKSAKPSGDSSSDIEVLEISSDDDDIMIVEPASSKKETKTKSTPQTSSTNTFNKSVDSTPKLPTFHTLVKTDKPAPLADAFKPAMKTWECPSCLVRNSDSATNCPCCNTAKPSSINVSPKRTNENATSTITTSGFGDKFKKPAGSWDCDSCMVKNKAEDTKCVCCSDPKPSAKPASAAPPASAPSGFGDAFKKPAGSWECDSCMVKNKADDATCVCCSNPKPGAAKSAAPAAPAASATSGFGDAFKKPTGAWECDSCMVKNKSEDSTCVCCSNPKPGTEKPKSTLQFKVDMPANAGSFKFGMDKADAAATAATTLPKANGFNFGGSASSQAPSGGFSFGASKDNTGFAFKPSESVAAAATFQFGAKPIDTNASKEEDKPATTTATFSFGAPPKSDAPATTGFVFGANTTTMAFGSTAAEKKDDKAETKVSTPSTGFSFGSSAATSASTTKVTETTTADKPSSDTPAATFVFGAPKPAVDVSSKDTPKPAATSSVAETPKATLSFGAPASTESKPAATSAVFTFGAAAAASSTSATSATTSAPSSSMFSFTNKTSEASSTNTTALPSFGSPAAPKPTFSFGKPAETTPVAQSANKPTSGLGSATPSFGSQATPSLFGNITSPTSSAPLGGKSDNKPFSFGAPENKTAPSFGEPSAKMPAFGSSTDNKPSGFPSSTATPTFGSPAPAANPTAAASPFGSSSNMFGSPATSTFGNTAASNIFSATTKASDTPAAAPGVFAFGASSQATTPASGGFNFSAGSNATPASNASKPGLFSFGASSSAAPVGNGFGGGSTFGAAATSSATPTATPTFNFNAPKPDASSFGAATPAPMFNAPSAQPSGAPPAYPGTGSTAPASGGFNFGTTAMPSSFNFGSQAPAPASGGFNFNAPAAAPTFDPNIQPTFNFSGGSNTVPPTFNATPSAVAPTRRPIKKAIRRMPRQ